MAAGLVERSELIWRLRQLRSFADVTTRDVEASTGVTKSTISRVEKVGTRDLEILERLCAFYGRFTAVELRVVDLLDATFDTRVWLNPAA